MKTAGSWAGDVTLLGVLPVMTGLVPAVRASTVRSQIDATRPAKATSAPLI
jgi:hypothetical protein